MSVNIFQDSGAPTLYNEYVKKSTAKTMGSTLKYRRYDDFSFLESDVYLEYRERYLKHCLDNKHLVGVAANLDVINNAEETYKNQKWFEKRGYNPIPVWHFGSDESYLKRYIDEGYEYIAMGGLIPNSSSALIGPLDKIWKNIICDKDGLPKAKIHGFAMTAFSLMRRYPWYSVDSSSWLKVGAYGKIFVPKKDRTGKWRWDKTPASFVISEIGIKKQIHGLNQTPLYQETIFNLIQEHGFPLGKCEYEGDEVKIIERGMINDYVWRVKWNIYHMHQFLKTLPQWPWSFFGKTREVL
ncbi:MAG TPA: hypothetical protein PLI14_06545 [Bacilli bacterium]|jgi:uncharacterized protein YkuJ|nr:hypothetical protein [Bacilli bacterium]